jgi:hypothetical protein
MMQKSALLLALLASTGACAASTEADFKAAYAAAEIANKDAGALRNQWTTTAAMLAASKKAADAGDFDGGQGSRGAGQGFDLPGDQREDPLEGFGNTLKSLRYDARRPA